MGFKDFIFKESFNKTLIIIAIPILCIQFFLFKYFYPFAGFINGDSYVYLDAAYHNLFINTYPIGYSKFLRLISVFTHSDTFVVGVQYALLQGSTIFFLFSIFYFYTPLKYTRLLLFFSGILNPVYLYLANYISSDSLFLSLSLLWFTLLIWILNRPTSKIIFANAFVLFFAFTVRYNALFYPLISISVVAIARRCIWTNILGLAVSGSLIVLFILTTTQKYEKLSGHRQFSPFSGWQLANNALYAYKFVDKNKLKKPPARFSEIDRLVRSYFDSTRDLRRHPYERMVASTVYMWDPNSPLSIYMENKFKGDTTASALKKWASVAPMMGDYGKFLIRAYPYEFTRYYLVPNALKYYAPPVEFLDRYSTGVDSVTMIAQVWFDYPSTKITTRFKDFKVNTLNYFPVLAGMMNVIFVLSVISFFFLKGYKYYSQLNRALILVSVLWIVNFGFSVFASAIALRFQLFPILVSLSFSILLIEYLVKAARVEAFVDLDFDLATQKENEERVTV